MTEREWEGEWEGTEKSEGRETIIGMHYMREKNLLLIKALKRNHGSGRQVHTLKGIAMVRILVYTGACLSQIIQIKL